MSKALPAKIKALRGSLNTTREKGSMALMDIKQLSSIPIAPDGYDSDQKALWQDICNTLHTVGLLQSVGIHQIKLYCKLYKAHAKAMEDIEKRGNIIMQTSSYGTTEKVNPSWTVAQNSFSSMQSIADRFGFTPVAQSKIKEIGLLGKEKPKDKEDEFGNL